MIRELNEKAIFVINKDILIRFAKVLSHDFVKKRGYNGSLENDSSGLRLSYWSLQYGRSGGEKQSRKKHDSEEIKRLTLPWRPYEGLVSFHLLLDKIRAGGLL